MSISVDERVSKLKDEIGNSKCLIECMLVENEINWQEINTVQDLLSALQFELDKTREAQINSFALENKKALSRELINYMEDFDTLENRLSNIGERLAAATKVAEGLKKLSQLYGYFV
ncbi:MAG: hypothetical protein JXR18_15535 [Neptuniibacter sp.]